MTSFPQPRPPSRNEPLVADAVIWTALGLGFVAGVGLPVAVRFLTVSQELLVHVVLTLQAVLAGVTVLFVLVLGMLPFLEAGPTVDFLRGIRGVWAAAREAVEGAGSRSIVAFVAFVTIAAPLPEVAWWWPFVGLGTAALVAVVVERRARR